MVLHLSYPILSWQNHNQCIQLSHYPLPWGTLNAILCASEISHVAFDHTEM